MSRFMNIYSNVDISHAECKMCVLCVHKRRSIWMQIGHQSVLQHFSMQLLMVFTTDPNYNLLFLERLYAGLGNAPRNMMTKTCIILIRRFINRQDDEAQNKIFSPVHGLSL